MPDQQCPVPMDNLADYRRTIAHKHDGITEDFEEKLHSLEHSHQKRRLNTVWTGDGSMSNRTLDHQSHQFQHQLRQAKHCLLPASNKKNKCNRKGDTHRRSQRGLRRWQQATINSQAAHSNHTQQRASQDRRNYKQQRTTGSEEDACGKESTPNRGQNSTYHNKHKMDQMSQS